MIPTHITFVFNRKAEAKDELKFFKEGGLGLGEQEKVDVPKSEANVLFCTIHFNFKHVLSMVLCLDDV